ncbi:MAG: hypothetical protein ACTSQ8_12290 [Candidatus Helarchaeota archaeon]
MRKEKQQNNWDYVESSDDEKGPYIKKVILPTTLYKHVLERGAETYKEVGFYLIGCFRGEVCYIYDLVEFDYSEQSGGFIESGMARYLRLKAGVPLGLRIVGHIHKHPGFTYYSGTDQRNFLQYGHANPLNAFLIYMIRPFEEVRGYTATAEKIFSIEVIIRELTSDEMLIEKEFKIELISKMVLAKNSKLLDFSRIFSENIGSETLKLLSRATIDVADSSKNGETTILEEVKINIIPRKVIELKNIGNNSRIHYRVFMEEQETVADLEKVLNQLTYIPKNIGYEIIFYEDGRKLQRDVMMGEIKYPLEWRLEKTVLIPLFKKFHKFWKGLFNLIDNKLQAKKQVIPGEIQVLEKKLEKFNLKTIFQNFTRFLNDLSKISEEMNGDKSPEIDEANENNSKQKQMVYKRDKLDYFI